MLHPSQQGYHPDTQAKLLELMARQTEILSWPPGKIADMEREYWVRFRRAQEKRDA